MKQTFLSIKWTVSRARDTYGYNIVTLTDEDTGKRYKTNGGGYDMVGTVFGDWLEDRFQDRLRTLNVANFYGARSVPSAVDSRDTVAVRVDGACGLSSMERIAQAIGLQVKQVRQAGFIVAFEEA